LAGTTPHKIIRSGREACDLNLPHPGQTKSLSRLRHPLPSDGRGTRRRIVRRLSEIRATGFAGQSFAKPETDCGHFPSPGERIKCDGGRLTNSIRDTIFNELQARAPHPLPVYTRPMKSGIEKKS
jgi:hypothetical protein